jgi:hypothetical protein
MTWPILREKSSDGFYKVITTLDPATFDQLGTIQRVEYPYLYLREMGQLERSHRVASEGVVVEQLGQAGKSGLVAVGHKIYCGLTS